MFSNWLLSNSFFVRQHWQLHFRAQKIVSEFRKKKICHESYLRAFSHVRTLLLKKKERHLTRTRTISYQINIGNTINYFWLTILTYEFYLANGKKSTATLINLLWKGILFQNINKFLSFWKCFCFPICDVLENILI